MSDLSLQHAVPTTGEPIFEPPLDKGIEQYVRILYGAGIETYESCEGGPGHAYPEPTIRFHGDRSGGFRALAIALQLPPDGNDGRVTTWD